MPRFFVKKEQVKETTIEILGEDIKHIKNVLRKQIGENIEICDKDTKKYVKLRKQKKKVF